MSISKETYRPTFTHDIRDWEMRDVTPPFIVTVLPPVLACVLGYLYQTSSQYITLCYM